METIKKIRYWHYYSCLLQLLENPAADIGLDRTILPNNVKEEKQTHQLV